MKRIILASASPRRKELLEQVGVTFEIIPSTCDEVCDETEPAKLVESLALLKAQDVFDKIDGDCLVIGSDTLVVKDGAVLGKPTDEAHAYAMLEDLQGDVHQVYSGVAVLERSGDQVRKENFSVMTTVEVWPMTEAQIKAYIATGDPMDKAGAYGIQGSFARYIKGIVGDYYSVVGLPISRVVQALHLE